MDTISHLDFLDFVVSETQRSWNEGEENPYSSLRAYVLSDYGTSISSCDEIYDTDAMRALFVTEFLPSLIAETHAVAVALVGHRSVGLEVHFASYDSTKVIRWDTHQGELGNAEQVQPDTPIIEAARAALICNVASLN